MSWIKTIPYEEADQALRRLYDKVAGPNQNIDNVLLIHSLRPNTLKGHMTLYKSVLHSSQNTLPKWYLEAIGVYVSYLNQCDYCVAHHQEGLKRLIVGDIDFDKMLEALKSDRPEQFFTDRYLLGMNYARILTVEHHLLSKSHIDQLKAFGFSEGEILELNQVAAYFNYVNRMVVGLGVNTDGDVLGLSPNDNSDPNNWSHL